MKITENMKNRQKHESEKNMLNKNLFGNQSALNKQKKKNLILSSIFFSLVAIITIIGSLGLTNNEADSVFGSNTYIGGELVSGYTVERASQVVGDSIKQKIDGITIEIMYKDKVWRFNENDFEIDTAVKQVVQTAYDKYMISKTNTKTDKNSTAKKMSNSKILNSLINNYTLSYNISLKNTFKDFDQKIDKIVSEIECEPTNASVVFNPNNKVMFEIKEAKSGVQVDREKLYQDLENQFLRTKEIKVYVSAKSIKPEIESDYFDNKLNLMSKFSTTLKDSQAGRRHNVDLALKKINGKVVKSGEKVSFNELTSPQTEEGGYKTAIVILNGKFVNGVGGGICQASTTLYNACVLANLEINEVHKHTLPVGYVELSLDAMVNDGYCDMIFTNTSDDDVYIKAYTAGDEAIVEIYGNSIPQDVVIKRVAEFIGNIPHNGDKVIIDEKGEYTDKVLYKGELYRVKYPREGYEAKAYKETYKNGELISREEIRHEKYLPVDGLVVEGAKEPPKDYVIPQSDVEIIKPQNTKNQDVEKVVEDIKQNNPAPFNP